MNIPIGWLIGISSILAGFIWLGGTWSQLWVPQEFLILIGGGIGSLVAANKGRNLRNLVKSIGQVFLNAEASKKENGELLGLLWDLLEVRDRGEIRAFEKLLESLSSGGVLSSYPALAKRSRLLEFISDNFKTVTAGKTPPDQIDEAMEQEISVIEIELKEPAESIDTLADSMPAFGIVAAIVGVIHALSSVSADPEVEETARLIGSALLGTLFGVFAAYAIFAPVGRSLMQRAESEERQFRAVKAVLMAHLRSLDSIQAVEFGRKMLYSDQRPSMDELEQKVTGGSSVRARE